MNIIIKKILFYNIDTNVFMAVTECNKKITGENTTRLQSKLEGFAFDIETKIKKQRGEEIHHITKIKEIDSPFFIYLKNNIGYIRPKILREIIKDYSKEELINIIENNHNILTKYKYIGEALSEKINQKWLSNKDLYELSYPLAKLGLTDNMLDKIYQYILNKKIKASEYIKMFNDNPYILIDIDNIGFIKADQIALKLGINKKSYFRIEAAIKFNLKDISNNKGDTAVFKSNIYKTINELINITIEQSFFEDCLNRLVKNEELIKLPNDFYSLKNIYDKEMYILKTFTEMNKKELIPIVDNIDEYIKNEELKNDIKLGNDQKEAIKKINKGYNSFSLCGYAGTGKSTVSKIVLNLFKNKNIVCAAVSGIATDRIRKATNKPSIILWYLTNPFMKMKKNSININNIDILLIDEASMVNNEQFYYLLKRFEHRIDKMKIILVGDKAQLPPIGPGNFFCDTIDSELLPYVELKQIYRQNDKMKLTIFASEIRHGKIPVGFDGIYKDFLWQTQEVKNFWARKSKNDPTLDADKKKNYIDIRNLIIDKYYKEIPKLFTRQDNWKDYIYKNQIITPMKRYSLGVEEINKQLSKKIADHSKEIHFGFKTFALWDKVVHIKNRDIDTYNNLNLDRAKGSFLEKEKIYNGMLGMIVDIDNYNKKIWVVYPIEQYICCYSMNDLKFLDLGYAITIHKAQGAEFDNVYIPITYAHFIMLNNKLLYTAITRAKKKINLIGEKSAFFYACKNIDKVKRISIIQILKD